jgi:LEA14-like dessication related protein
MIYIFVFTNAFEPEIKGIRELKITRLTSTELSLDVIIQIENGNFFTLNLKNIDLFLVNHNDTLGFLDEPKEIIIPANSMSEKKLKVNLETKKVANILKDGKDTLTLNIVVKAETKLLFITFPVNLETELNFALQENLSNFVQTDSKDKKIIDVKSVSINKIGLTETQLLINFTLNNPYEVKLKLVEYPSVVFINDSKSGVGNLQNEIEADSLQSNVEGTFVFDLNNFQAIKSAFGVLFSQKLHYKTDGFLVIEIVGIKVKLPFSYNGELFQ